MSLRALSALAVFLLPGALLAQVPAESFQVRYASNLNVGDSVINIVNTGAIDGNDPAGNVCVNIYTFRPNEEPINCCTCLTTPDGLNSISVNGSLNTNPLLNETQNSLVIKLFATRPVGGACNAAAPGAPAPGIRAWGTTLHATPGGGYGVTETAFSMSAPAASEISKLTGICSFIRTYGSSTGICRGCQVGGLATTVGGE